MYLLPTCHAVGCSVVGALSQPRLYLGPRVDFSDFSFSTCSTARFHGPCERFLSHRIMSGNIEVVADAQLKEQYEKRISSGGYSPFPGSHYTPVEQNHASTPGDGGQRRLPLGLSSVMFGCFVALLTAVIVGAAIGGGLGSALASKTR